MIKQKQINVGGDDYLISTLPATKGLKVLKQLTKLIGPSFAELAKSADDAEKSAMSIAMEKLFENLDSVDVENLAKDLMASVSKGNTVINFDMEFSGDYGKLFTLLKEVVEFNFGSVFTLFGSEENQ